MMSTAITSYSRLQFISGLGCKKDPCVHDFTRFIKCLTDDSVLSVLTVFLLVMNLFPLRQKTCHTSLQKLQLQLLVLTLMLQTTHNASLSPFKMKS